MVRIPVHGIGVVAPGAVGVEAFRALLESGRSSVMEVDRFDTSGLRSHRAALVRDFNPRDFIPVMKLRRMNPLSRLVLSAAKLAIEDAGQSPGSDTGVALGTAFGPVQTSVDYMNEYLDKGPALAPPQLFAESVANAPGSHIAIEWGLRGFNLTITQRESSALAAAMFACEQLAKGGVTAALIGGVEETNEMLFSVLDRARALAHAEADLEEAPRPMDDRRNGVSLGEGAAVLVAGTGARDPYAWLSGFGIARDTTASISDWGSDAHAVAGAMRGAISDADIDLDQVDAIYLSANGSKRGDAVEAAAITQLFGATPPPLVATKGIFGEYAAGGGLQLAAALLAVSSGTLHPSVGHTSGPLTLQSAVRPAQLRHVLVNTISAGGGILCAVISRENG